jgi:hypothetical protein
MSKEVGLKEWRASLLLPAACVAVATSFLVWFAVGDQSTGIGDYYFLGPYDVGPESGFIVGGVAAVVALASVALLVVRAHHSAVGGWSWALVAVLVATGSLGAYGWRAATAGAGGAPIGAGLVALTFPVVIALLLGLAAWLAFIAEKVGAPALSSGERRHALRRTWLLTVAAMLVAPAMYAGMYALSQYDDSRGVITARQYADVQIGQTRPAVHDRLGRELLGFVGAFPPVAPGLLCDYYWDVETVAGPNLRRYQFCFRRGVLVSKDVK